MPSSIARPARLRADLDALRDEVAGLRFALAVPDQGRRLRLRNRVVASVDTHLDARLAAMDAPMLVSLFGPTGSGKSTITNTIAGRQISRSGVLRPTTREAVVWCHRDHADRVRRSALAETGSIEVVEDDHPLLRSIVLIDTPDVDSIAAEHRVQTEKILLMSDASFAVTTPQRYADAVPWELLEDLTARGMPLHVVMNRMHRRSSGAVTDLVGLLRDHRIGGVSSTDDVFTVQEQRVRGDGRLSTGSVKRLVEELERLAMDRDRVIRQGVEGAVGRVAEDSRLLAAAVESQAEDAERRWAAVEQAYRSQIDEIERHLDTGDLVKAEVVERWRRLVGVGDLSRIIRRGVSRVRDVFVPGGLEARADAVGAEVRNELTQMAVHRVVRAASLAVAAWEIDAAGMELLEATERGSREEIEERAGAEIDEWLADVVSLVASQGKSRFRIARVVTIGVNATATVLLIAVFASTGGLTGGEVGVVAGTAAAQQTILEHLFGSATAGRLAARARSDLAERFERLLREDAARYRRTLDATIDPHVHVERVQVLARTVELALEELFDG